MRSSIFLACVASVALAAPLAAQGLTTRGADPRDVASLDGIIAAFYDVISGAAGQPREWARDSTLYRAGVRFAYPDGAGRWRAVDHDEYINQSNAFLEQGFFEREVHRVVQRFGNMAHVFSTYEWHSPTPDGPQRGRGINSISLIFEDDRWWITYAQWDSESAENPIPAEFDRR